MGRNKSLKCEGKLRVGERRRWVAREEGRDGLKQGCGSKKIEIYSGWRDGSDT